MRRGALVALALVAGACARDGGAPRLIEHRSAAAAPLDAGALDAGDSPCVTACLRDRQMVAMSADALVALCRRECIEVQ